MNKDYKLYVHISPSGKRYYGITGMDIKKRWKSGKGYKKNKHFTNSINKYGWDNFTHEILFNNLTEAEAKLLEQCYIALYDTTNQDKGYNITLGGEGSNGLKRSEETKQKMREAQKGENNSFYGKKHTKETIKKMSESHKRENLTKETIKKISETNRGKNNSMYGKHHTEEAKQKMSEAKKGKNNTRSRNIICITTNRIFFTIAEGAEYYNIKCPSSITECCKGKKKSAGKLPDGTKLVWRYLNYKHNKTYKVIKNKEVA